jgi:hypothetical protein
LPLTARLLHCHDAEILRLAVPAFFNLVAVMGRRVLGDAWAVGGASR